MSNLTRTIESLAADFARNVLAALRDASLSDLAGVGGAGAPARKSARVTVARTRRAGRGKARPGWPKCKTCGKNAHPRGKGYCWEHALAAGVAKGTGGPGKLGKRRRAAKAK
jgi:hypothetical protein